MRDSLWPKKRFEEVYIHHADMIYRLCFVYMKNKSDTEDAVQDVFVKMIEKNPEFESEDHEKAWLIVTAQNICRNKLRHWWRKNEDIDNLSIPDEKKPDELLNRIIKLPERSKAVLYLYYYEGYNSVEIAKMLKIPQSTVRNRLRTAKKLLKKDLEGENDE